MLRTLLSLWCLLVASFSYAETDWEWHVAQKIIIDLRAYCPGPALTDEVKPVCPNGLTALPSAYEDLIRDSAIGGVILFADNIESLTQTHDLVAQLQAAALRARRSTPLFIAIDQEGGRVARLPRAQTVAMPGNMAIGATYEQHGKAFAQHTGDILAQQLASLGVNLNFAPNIDVNANPDNPVINVRSFGENPERVANLGIAYAQAQRSRNIISAFKHFPGHGDTATDSHTGLPRVEHALKEIENMDVLPFARAIKAGAADLIMTAHIQYPALDQTLVESKVEGEKILVPATLSRQILQHYLREKLRYKGVVVSDALDMAAISQHFTPRQALHYAFDAGVDIALMPLPIKSDADVAQFKQLISDTAQALRDHKLNQHEFLQSSARVAQLKKRYHLAKSKFAKTGHVKKTAKQIDEKNLSGWRQVEQSLADAATTVVKNTNAFPLTPTDWQNTISVMPTQELCNAWLAALDQQKINATSCISLLSSDALDWAAALATASHLIAANIVPSASIAELGTLDNLAQFRDLAALQKQSQERWLSLQHYVSAHPIKWIVVSLRAPYELQHYRERADAMIALYSYNVYRDPQSQAFHSASLISLAKVLNGELLALGRSPVTLQ